MWEAESRGGHINSTSVQSQFGLYLCAKEWFRVPTLFGVLGAGAGECPYWGFNSSTLRLQC